MIIVRPESLYLTLDLEFYCVDEVKTMCSMISDESDVNCVRCSMVLWSEQKASIVLMEFEDGKAIVMRLSLYHRNNWPVVPIG